MADIYPNEAYPSDAAVSHLDGTTDQKTGLGYIAKGTGPASTPSYEIQYNRRQQRANARLTNATEGLVVDEGNLSIGVYPCNYSLGDERKRYPGATAQSVPDDATRYVYIDASNTLQITAAYPTDAATFIPLARIVTSSGAITIASQTGYARLLATPLHPQLALTAGAESSDAIAVTIQLEDAAGETVARRWIGELWLSDSNFGDLSTTAPTGGLAVTTGQQLGVDVATDKHLRVVSDSSGVAIVSVTDSGTPTFYAIASAAGIEAPASVAITFS